jgi:inosose dehydratase
MMKAKVANAPCSWGVLEFEEAAEPVTWQQVLDEIAESGYDGTELGDWGFMPTDHDTLAIELERRGLQMLGAFVPVPFANGPEAARKGTEVALRTAKLLAALSPTAFIVLADDNATVPHRRQRAGNIVPADGLSGEAWSVFAAGVESVARAVRDETGLRTVFHHHGGGYVETPAEIDTLLELTDPGLVGLCLDTGHYALGGGDPAEALQRLAPRIWHVHFKDFRREALLGDYLDSVHAGVFPELGRGSVDFRAVLSGLDSINYTGWIVVEQDVLGDMGSPLESARRNRTFVRNLGI